MDNKKKVILNLIVSLLSQAITLILGFVVPRIVLVNYGSDVNGLTNTIGQIFTYVALLEAGISSATCNRLYKPIKDDNKDKISYWVSAAQRYYRKISVIYFFIVVLLAVFLPVVFKTNVNYWTIFFYILFEGLTSVIIFYFVNCWTCLLTASGKNYITNAITLLVKVLSYGVKIGLCLLKCNIAFIQLGYLFVSIIQLGIYYIYMRKHYPWIDYKAAPKNTLIPDRNSYIIIELAWTIFSSTDMIVLSIFVSTALSSVYSVYAMVFTAINGLLNAAYHSLSYNLGHAFVVNIEKYKQLHNLYNSIFVGAMTVLMSVTYILIIPFIRLYTAGVNDISYINYTLPLLFCLVQMLSWSRYVSGNISGIAGYAKQTSIVSLIEAGINIIASVILVQKYGIVGVLVATVVALPLKVLYLNCLAEHKIMNRSPKKTIMILGINWVSFIVVVIVNEFITINISSYLQFAAYGLLLTLVIGVAVMILNGIVNKDLLVIHNLLRKK